MRGVEVNVGKRLLQLADSFAEEVSADEVDTFTAQVYARLGLPAPSGTARTTGEPAAAGSPGEVLVKEHHDRSGAGR